MRSWAKENWVEKPSWSLYPKKGEGRFHARMADCFGAPTMLCFGCLWRLMIESESECSPQQFTLKLRVIKAWHRRIQVKTVYQFLFTRQCFFYIYCPAKGSNCSNGGIVPNTAFTFRVVLATPRTPSNLCIYSSFFLAHNLNIQVVNSQSYSIT